MVEKGKMGEGQLLFTKEEWMKKNRKGGIESSHHQKNRGISNYQGVRGVRDRSKVRCFKCSAYGHFVVECRNPRRERDQKTEVNLTQTQDKEPALLLVECNKQESSTLLLNEGEIMPELNKNGVKKYEYGLWYLDNGASNHMTGQRSKFKNLDESIIGQVRFGDGSTVEIKGKGVISFICKIGEEITFREVCYIPTLCNNIISLGQLSEYGNKVIIKGEYLWVYDGN